MKKSVIIISLFSAFLILVFNVKSYAQTGQEIKNNQDTIISVFKGEQLVEKYGCLECHKTHGPKVGPAYHGVGIKYRKEFAEKAADSIAFYIKSGSKGKYPCYMLENAEMPPFDIPKEERMAIANWIVSLRPMKDMYRKQDEVDK
jgi:cytochrome c551/c552